MVLSLPLGASFSGVTLIERLPDVVVKPSERV